MRFLRQTKPAVKQPATGLPEVSALFRQLQKGFTRGHSFDTLQEPPPFHSPARLELDGQTVLVRILEERTLFPRGWWGRTAARMLTLRAHWTSAGQAREHSCSVVFTPDGRVYRA